MHYVNISSICSKIPHPPFVYENEGEAVDAVRSALETGLFVREEPDSAVPGENNMLMFQIGPGTVMRVLSERALHARINTKAAQADAEGLVRPVQESAAPYKLIVQTDEGQMDPLDFATRAEAQSAVLKGVGRGHIHHEIAEGEEVYIQTGPGTVFIVLSTKNYDAQRRKAMEDAFRSSYIVGQGKA